LCGSRLLACARRSNKNQTCHSSHNETLHNSSSFREYRNAELHLMLRVCQKPSRKSIPWQQVNYRSIRGKTT
jgi:hypothetical protein